MKKGWRPFLILAVLGAPLLAGARAAPNAAPLVDLTPLDTPAGERSSEPSFTVASDGTLYLSWMEQVDSTRYALRIARRWRAGWSGAMTVTQGDSFFVNGADVPAMAALGGDKLMIAWPWRSGGDPEAYDVRIAGTLDAGRHWTPPMIPHRDGTPTEHGFVSLVPGQEGGVRAFWLDGRKFAKEGPPAGSAGVGPDHHEMTLRTAWLGFDGAMTDEAEVDDRVCDCCPIDAIGHGASAVVVYRDRSREEVRDIAVAWLEGRRWSEPAPVHDDGWKIDGCPVNGPAADAAGDRTAVAWFTSPRDSAEVRIAFSSDRGRHFAAPIRVDDGSPLGRVSVILLQDGSALVGWLEARGDSAAFQARRIRPGGVVGPAAVVARFGSRRGLGIPRMALSRDRVYFAWTDSEGMRRVRVASARVPS